MHNQLNSVFEIRNLSELVSRVCTECNNCSLVQKQPCGKHRPALPKSPQMLRQKNEVWAIDELQLISPNTGKIIGFNKIICATDLFSNFCIVDQVRGNLDAKQVLDFIQQKIIAVFGYPRILVTDNATCMNNSLVSQTCELLNIHFCTIAPYSAKSNLQELLNRAILDTLRALTSNHYSPPTISAQMIGPVVNLINSLTFRELKNISPYFLQFCKRPKVDLLVYYDMDPNLQNSKEDFIQNIIQINSVITKIRLAQISSRKYPPTTQLTQSYQNKIEVGSIVSIQNPELVIKKENFKLRPKFKNRFLVTERTASSAVLVPCAEVYLADYFTKHKPTTEDNKLRIKADLSNIKLLTNSLLINSNRSENFYRNFFRENQLPPTFYVSQDDNRAQVRNLEEITQSDSPNNLEFDIHLVRTFMKRTPSARKGILSNIRTRQICNIVKHLKPHQTVKRVKFNQQVTCFKLVAPAQIYHCLYPKTVPLKDTFDPPIRKLQNNIFCVCNKCRMLLKGCSDTHACDMCFGSGCKPVDSKQKD